MTESDTPLPIVIQYVIAFKKAIEEVKKIQVEYKVIDTLNIHNGPSTTAIHGLPLNSLVLVQREGNIGQLRYQAGPYNLLNIKGEMYAINLPSGPTKFRNTTIKPYLIDPRNIQVKDI